VERATVAADDAEPGEVVGGLEAGRHDDAVDRALLAVGVDDAGAGDRS